MPETYTTADQYLASLPAERQEPMKSLRKIILKNIPKGFKETISSAMISYCVPFDKFPQGYHCNPSQPLPFASIASQKNHIALYHMGLYSMPELLNWFIKEYPSHSASKLDMGKSCIRFKRPEHIPYQLIGELFRKVDVDDWISSYQKALQR